MDDRAAAASASSISWLLTGAARLLAGVRGGSGDEECVGVAADDRLEVGRAGVVVGAGGGSDG